LALIVLDASAAIAVLLNVGVGTSAPAIRERLAGSDEEPHVPHLFEIEVSSALRRHALVHNLSEKRGSELLEDLASMKLNRYPHTALLRRTWELKGDVTVQDAAYIALAETLDTPLVTMDARLARVSGIHAVVEVYG
jgi:predicted nucleic acid-binding protein